MSPKTAVLLIKLMGWGFIIFGIVFVTMAFAGYDDFARALVPLFDWTGDAATEPLNRGGRWYAAIMSGLSAGFGALYVFLIAPLLTVSHADARHIAKRGGLIAAFIWYIVDGVGSLAAGVPSNVATNTVFLLAFVVPLVMVKFDQT